MKPFALSFALCVCSISLSFAQNQSEYSFKEVYPLAAPQQLTLSTSDGDVQVIPADVDEVQVFYIVTKGDELQAISRKELEQEVMLKVSHDNHHLNIEVKHKDQDSWKFAFKDRLEVGFVLHVPRTTACDLRTSDGDVSLQGLRANVKINTSDGDIRVSDVRGDVSGRTSDGDLVLETIQGHVDFRTSDGDINLNAITGDVETSTSDGNIQLTNIKGAVSLKTSDGDITFRQLSGSLLATTSDGNIRGSMEQLQRELTLKTSDGTIDVVLPARLGLDLTVRGGSLSVPLNNFTGRSDEKRIEGKINGGGIGVNISTGDGRVKLAFAE